MDYGALSLPPAGPGLQTGSSLAQPVGSSAVGTRPVCGGCGGCRSPALAGSRARAAPSLTVCPLSPGPEDDVVKSKKTFRSQAIVNQNAEAELMLEGDDDAVSLLQEKEVDNLAGACVRACAAASAGRWGRRSPGPGV